MGSGGSGGNVPENQSDDVVNEITMMTPYLPVAELLNGGIIRLTGLQGFFNVDSLLEPAWLKGKMTLEEYRAAIRHVNERAIRVQLSFPKYFVLNHTMDAERAKAKSGTAAVEELNRRYKSVRFTYQPGMKEGRIFTVWKQTMSSSIFDKWSGDGGACRGIESYIYINVN